MFRAVILLATIVPIVLETFMFILLLLKICGLGGDMRRAGRRSFVHVMQRDGTFTDVTGVVYNTHSPILRNTVFCVSNFLGHLSIIIIIKPRTSGQYYVTIFSLQYHQLYVFITSTVIYIPNTYKLSFTPSIGSAFGNEHLGRIHIMGHLQYCDRNIPDVIAIYFISLLHDCFSC